MIIITLFISCLLIIGAYWNSYSNLLKQLKGSKSQPPQYNVIILAGNSDSSSQDFLARLKEELLNNSDDVGGIYDEVLKKHNIGIQTCTNTISNNSITPSDQIHPKSPPENNAVVSGFYQGKRVYAVIQKCVGDVCQFVNLTFTGEEQPELPKITEPIASQLKLTKIKLSQNVPLKNDSKRPLYVNILKKETTTILKYTESLGLYEPLLKIISFILSYLNGQFTLPIIAIAMPALSVLINCYRWGKTKRTYEDIRTVRNAPYIQESLTKIVKSLENIASEQEQLYRSDTIKIYSERVNEINQRLKKLEKDVLNKEVTVEEEMGVLMNKKNTHILRTLNTVNDLRIERQTVLKKDKTHLLLLYEKENFLLTEIVFKLSSAEIQFDYFINELETAMSKLGHCEKIKLSDVREKIEALKADRNDLLNFFDHPTLLRCLIGNRALTDHVPRRFLVSTNQSQVGLSV